MDYIDVRADETPAGTIHQGGGVYLCLSSTKDFIIKTWGPEYPRLAENEFFCMRAVQKAGIAVPRFFLSNDKKFFVIERFDRSPSGQWLGFEELGVLQAKNKKDNYSGSYERAAKTVAEFASSRFRRSSLAQYYKILVMSALLRNGDAHLNRWVLYSLILVMDTHHATM